LLKETLRNILRKKFNYLSKMLQFKIQQMKMLHMITFFHHILVAKITHLLLQTIIN
jgi:hypothetical protein